MPCAFGSWICFVLYGTSCEMTESPCKLISKGQLYRRGLALLYLILNSQRTCASLDLKEASCHLLCNVSCFIREIALS